MLKELRISNLVLVESAEVLFHAGLTAITGETGAGKTILLEALKLATGCRADSDTVRRGASKATIEAAFEIKDRPEIVELLEEAGLNYSEAEPLLLKREISAEGRSRAFINCQMVPLSLLQTLGEKLVDFTDQHAHHSLLKEDYQLEALDIFAGTKDLAADAKKAKEQLRLAKKELSLLQEALVSGQKESELATRELEELTAANFQENEEENLNAEHKRLANVQEIAAKINSVCTLLDEPPHALIAALKRSSPLLRSASNLDPSLQEPGQLLAQGIASLEEVRHLLQAYLGRMENDPQRLSFVEERLALYHKFRRKFGDPLAYRSSLHEKLGQLDGIQEKIDVAAATQKEAESQLHILRNKLFEKRQRAAEKLSRTLTKILRTMNMPHAEVAITITDGKEEEDKIDFFLQANLGEKRALVQEHASGGELSRLMLALQTSLASSKTEQAILVFDEIDANVGGQTASAIAENLAAIAEHRQVLCVTHFSQVAKKCGHHIRIYKQEADARTVTYLESLDPKGREAEFARMRGESICN